MANGFGANKQEGLDASGYLFSYFVGNGEDGLHLAWSADGLRWEALNGGRSLLAPEVGRERLMRDPFVCAGPEGTFHLVWTDSWSDRTIGYAHSRDLIHWSPQREIPVMGHEPDARNCWAPEIAYDAARERFLILWATTIPGRFPDTDGSSEDAYNHRMYVVTTPDFATFSPAQLLFDPGHSVIDATIVPIDGRFLMIYKDETLKPIRKHLRLAVADSIAGPYRVASEAFTDDWVEGPTILKIDDAYIIYFDRYRVGRYGAVRSRDLVVWEDISDQIVFPPGTRHGAAFAAPNRVIEPLRRL